MPDNQNHSYARSKSKSRLKTALVITTAFLAIEFIGGLYTNSLALLSDAGHMLTDVLAIGLSLFSMWFAEKPKTPQKTFGFYRAEILAAFINGATLVLIAIFIIFEAYERFGSPYEVKSLEMFFIACAGLAANAAVGIVLSRSKSESLNVKGAYMHVISDALGSIGAIAAGAIMYFTQWYYADILVSLLICGLIAYSSITLLVETIHILMEGTPSEINYGDVEDALSSIRGVDSIHDLHIWSLTSGKYLLTGHLILDSDYPSENISQLLQNAEQILKENYNITHSTLQIETQKCNMKEL